MAKLAERGTKRNCGSCDSKFYDLNRDPITCPICGTVYQLETPAPKTEAEEDDSAETELAETVPGAEIISLEEADAQESAEALPSVEDEENLPDLEDDDKIPAADDDDTFLEEDEDSDSDVTGILGNQVAPTEES